MNYYSCYVDISHQDTNMKIYSCLLYHLKEGMKNGFSLAEKRCTTRGFTRAVILTRIFERILSGQ